MKIDYSQASQEIQSRHFFTREEPTLSRFDRFFSADPRFPFSIAYPQELEPFYDDTEYLNILYVTFGKGILGVICLGMDEFCEVKPLWRAEKGANLVTVGEQGFHASRVVWNAGDGRYGEWVVFQVGHKRWTIFRNSIQPISSDDFSTILRSFRFLDEAFFHSLGVRWSYDV